MTDEQKAENLRIAQDGDVAPDVWPPRWLGVDWGIEPSRSGIFLFDRRLWKQAFACTLSREHGLVPNRDADEDLAVPIDDVVIEQIERWPEPWRPSNPHYVKSHISAPGTVRSWFRKMRAADVETAVKLVTPPEGAFFYVRPNLLPWTVLDTMKVVDRETMATYMTWFDKIFHINPKNFVRLLPVAGVERWMRVGGEWRAFTVPTLQRRTRWACYACTEAERRYYGDAVMHAYGYVCPRGGRPR